MSQIDLHPPRTPEIIGTMGKKKIKKQSAKATLAEVIKEMAKPRVATSARTCWVPGATAQCRRFLSAPQHQLQDLSAIASRATTERRGV